MQAVQIDRKQLEEMVVTQLGPYLGQSMAAAAVQGHCSKLKIDGNLLTRPDLERLLTALCKGMTLFVGPEKSRLLIQSLAADLHLEGFVLESSK